MRITTVLLLLLGSSAKGELWCVSHQGAPRRIRSLLRRVVAAGILGVSLLMPSVAAAKAKEHKLFQLIDEAVANPKRRPALEAKIQGEIEKLFADLERATGKKLHLPAHKLQIVRNFDGDTREGAVVLASGSITSSYTQNSLLIARGAILVAHSNNSSAIAGQYLDISHQNSGVKKALDKFNVISSGGPLNVSHARSSVIVSAGKDSISHMNDSVNGGIVPPPKSQLDSTPLVLKVRDAASQGVALPQGKSVVVVKLNEALPKPKQTHVLSAVTEDYKRVLFQVKGWFQWAMLELEPSTKKPYVNPKELGPLTTDELNRKGFSAKYKKLVKDHRVIWEAESKAYAERQALSKEWLGTEGTAWAHKVGESWQRELFLAKAAFDGWNKTLKTLDKFGKLSESELEKKIAALKKKIDDVHADESKKHLIYDTTFRLTYDDLGALETLLLAKDGSSVRLPFGKSAYRPKQ